MRKSKKPIELKDREHIDNLIKAEYLGIPDIENLKIINPFDLRTKDDIENPHIHLIKMMIQPKYFAFTVKNILNIELLPFQLVILNELWFRKYPMLIANRGGSKSFMLAVYTMLKCLLHQGIKVVIVGSSFRQAKVIFEYCETIWNNAPVLRDIVGADTSRKQGPRRDIDRCMIRVGESLATAIPLGSGGDKIRGMRAGVILCDEFACCGANTLVETNAGLIRISDAEKNLPLQVINKYGEFESVSMFVRTPETDVYEVKTEAGFSFKCSPIHKVLTAVGEWKLGKDLSSADYLPFNNTYISPANFRYVNNSLVDESVAKSIANADLPCIPDYILQSSHSVLKAFTQALFKNSRRVKFTHPQLAEEVHVVLAKLNTFSVLTDNVVEISKEPPPKTLQVLSVEKLAKKEILYDFHLPQTHSFYGNCFIQHNSVPKAIYQNVIEGFAAVSQSPAEAVKRAAKLRVFEKLGMSDEMEEELTEGYVGNQSIIAGTAYYGFNQFADYWREYKAIILSRGDPDKLSDIFKGRVPAKFDWRHYSIIRMPVELMPENFMDEEHVARSQATVHTGIYLMEFRSCFATDSNGFFRRSLIEACVAREENLRDMPAGASKFQARLRGDHKFEYVYAIDPASEQDNFCILILELREDHRRIVYCWTFTREKHKEQVRRGYAKDKDFYKYCARKVRNLMKVFPCKHIMLDAQGGGRAISEALHDPENLQAGEECIWEVREPGVEKDTDFNPGLHVLELVEFSRQQWLSEANHGLRKDFESKLVLFPYFDTISLYLANQQDKEESREYDTFEDCVTEIEELKDELATIEHTQTPNTNRDRWDTPSSNIGTGRKGRLRKDRYTSLLMANMAARQMQKITYAPVGYEPIGGFAANIVQEAQDQRQNNPRKDGLLYSDGPDWWLKGINNKSAVLGIGVRRG